METLRIALVDLSRSFGGGQVALANLANALSQRGHEVHVILGADKIHERISELCVSSCSLHRVRGYSNIFEFVDIVQQARMNISEFDQKHNFDVINTGGVNGFFVPSQLSDKLFVTLHGNNTQRGLALLRLSFQSSAMRAAVANNSMNFVKNVFGHLLFGRYEKKACRNAKRVLALTSTEAYYAAKNYSVPKRKIRVVPNVTLNLNASNLDVPLKPQDKQIILSVGALEFIKGTPILAKAIEYVLSSEDVVFVSVGNGPLMTHIRNLQAKFPERVVVFPHLSSVSSLYAKSSLLVQASLYEAFSLSMAESMLAGKPVVAFRLSSIPDLITDEYSGLLAKPLSAKDLAAKVISLIKDKQKACELGINAQKTVNELCGVESIGQRMESILREV